MIRFATAMATVWLALAQLNVAHAHASGSSLESPAMCADSSQPLRIDALMGGRSLDVLQPERSDDAPPAWCISPDDPRCAPRDTGSPRQSRELTAPVLDVTGDDSSPLYGSDFASRLRPMALGAARLGIAMLLERPPRA